jgi:ElaB/YqjD/DUF883 family membrane-anchored ribosome-binding protein
MGKKPDEVEREIRQTRDRISRKLEALQERVEGDVNQAIGAAGDEASTVINRISSTIRLEERMEESPYTMLAGGLGLGVLLGVASESLGGGRGDNHRQRDERNGNGHRNGGGFSPLDGVIAGLGTVAADVVGTELRQFIRTGLYGDGRGESREPQRERRKEDDAPSQ